MATLLYDLSLRGLSLPDPEAASRFFERLTEEKPAAAHDIAADVSAFRYALTTFSYSRFLSEAVLRNPGWILELARAKDLHLGYNAERYQALLADWAPSAQGITAESLVLFRRKQILRILLRDVLRYADLSEVTRELSALADAIVNAAWTAVRGRQIGPSLSVIALGKLGGNELNYSSDIDLLFIAPDDSNSAYFKQAANRLTELLSSYTPEGLCYRVDLRLRPDGRYGEICHSLEGAKHYYATRARDWELQMLIKARVCAGDRNLGRALLKSVEPLIYKTTTDFHALEAVSETRARIHEKLRKRREPGLDVKLAKGGIRDIEFLVQCLQRLHGGREPWVRHGGTLLALTRLRDKGLLSIAEYARLASAYQFLRHLEHRLQFDEDRQTHTVPTGDAAMARLARKMPGGGESLEPELHQHLASVQELYDRVIHMQEPRQRQFPDPSGNEPAAVARPDTGHPVSTAVSALDAKLSPEMPSVNLGRYLDRNVPNLARAIGATNLTRSHQSVESFLEKLVARPDLLATLESNEELAHCTLDLFEHSRYFADQLVRHPSLLTEVGAACTARQGRTGFHAPQDPAELRRFFREQMVRIQADSVYHGVPVFKTLKRTSDLAEAVISAAYEIALAENPVNSDGQMMVIALGRLGMREFDLASDADLVFTIPESEGPRMAQWTSVALRTIHLISAYTGDGVIFSVDTRLRPSGREGALVQTEDCYKDYFQRHAEAWEGISYMKARAIAGDRTRGTEFLNELQELDWRRYGQSGRSRLELAAMRARLEKEFGSRNPLKAGSGGYYDIDFALMYLRLKSAGIFFKVLNTPERIDIVEKMGHLDRDDAVFLREAATFFRALDHGLRVSTGHAEGRLPGNRTDAAILAELVQRWSPAAATAASLDQAFHDIRQKTRAFYERVFGRT